MLLKYRLWLNMICKRQRADVERESIFAPSSCYLEARWQAGCHHIKYFYFSWCTIIIVYSWLAGMTTNFQYSPTEQKMCTTSQNEASLILRSMIIRILCHHQRDGIVTVESIRIIISLEGKLFNCPLSQGQGQNYTIQECTPI